MSWPDPRPALIRLSLLLPLLWLGGCIEEVRPLYGSGGFLANGGRRRRCNRWPSMKSRGASAIISATI